MTEQAAHPFAEDRADFDQLGARAIAMLGEYLRDLPDQPVDRVVPTDVRLRLMSLPLPEQGQSPGQILDFLGREIMPWPVAIGHRRSYAWVNSPPAPIAILADSVASTMNCGLDGYDHSAIFLMVSVGRWIMELVGFPVEGSQCLLLTGGSVATLNALSAARHRAAAAARAGTCAPKACKAAGSDLSFMPAPKVIPRSRSASSSSASERITCAQSLRTRNFACGPMRCAVRSRPT